MTDITPFLKQITSLPGLTGYESPVRDAIAEAWRPLVDELSTSKLGSLHGLRRAAAKDAPSILVAAHMDAIGLMVSSIDSTGLLHCVEVGGIDPRILPGQLVTVHGQKDLPGIIQLIPDRLLPKSKAGSAPAPETLFVDVGLSYREVSRLVHVGDLISFGQKPIDLSGGLIAGHSMDNRAAVAALTVCLEELKNYNLAWNVWSVATVQEEETLYGARTSAFELKPDLAIAVDVTFARGPGASDHRCFHLGKGPTIGLGSNIHPALCNRFKKLAEEMDIPYAVELLPRSSGTDAVALQVTEEGIPCEVIGIPLRYMHSPIEIVSMKDIHRTGRLLARFISQLEPDSLETLFTELHQ